MDVVRAVFDALPCPEKIALGEQFGFIWTSRVGPRVPQQHLAAAARAIGRLRDALSSMSKPRKESTHGDD